MNDQQSIRQATKPWLTLKLFALPAVLLGALVALFALGAAPVAAQENIIRIDKQPADREIIRGSIISFTLKVTGTVDLLIGSVTDNSCAAQPVLKAGSDANANGELNPGETWEYTCTVPNVLADFNNFAEVKAVQKGTNTPFGDTAAARVRVLNPGVHVIKTKVTSDPILQGDPVFFQIDVRNTGLFTIAKADIKLADVLCSPAAALIPSAATADDLLAPDPDHDLTNGINGETWSYTCRVPNVIDNFVNSVDVTVKDAKGNQFSHSATASATVLNQGLAVEKSPHKSTVAENQVVTWTIKVYNIGEVAMAAPTVVDNQCGGGAPIAAPTSKTGDGDNDLEKGEFWTYVCAKQYTVPAPKTSTVVTNTVTVTATTLVNVKTLVKQAKAEVLVLKPGLQIEKKPYIQYAYKGDTVKFDLEVTNTGAGDMTIVEVIDTYCSPAPVYAGGDANGDGKLNPDNPATAAVNEAEVWVYKCSVPNVQASFNNVATVKARDGAGVLRTATVPSFIGVFNPGLNLEKSPVEVSKGMTATFTLKVTNKGDAELANVKVTDAFCDTAVRVTGNITPTDNITKTGTPLTIDADDDGKLDPNDVWHYTCRDRNVTSDYENSASAEATDPLGGKQTASAKAKVTVLTPGIILEKSPAYATIRQGESFTWTLTIRNTSNATLTLTSPGYPVDTWCTPTRRPATDVNGDNLLSKNEAWVYDCPLPFVPLFFDEIINESYVEFADVGNPSNKVSDSEYSRLLILSDKIDIEKKANVGAVLQGSDVEFTFSVRNLNFSNFGNNPELTDVTVTDLQCPGGAPTYESGDTDGDKKLDVTETWVYKCTVKNVQSTIVDNFATVKAKDAFGNPVTDTDNEQVIVINATLDVTKKALVPMVYSGSDAEFNIEVKNTSVGETLKLTSIEDALCKPGNAPSFVGGDANLDGKINAGETWRYTCKLTNVTQDTINSVTVKADVEGRNVSITRQASDEVKVIRVGLNLEKNPSVQNIKKGETADFVILVQNNGNIALKDVVVMDPQCSNSALPRKAGDANGDGLLSVGETWAYGCSVSNVEKSFVNSASVTANDANGKAVTPDSDTAQVNVVDPALSITKSPAFQTVLRGKDATFQIEVRNNGNVDLTNVQVTDGLCSVQPPARTDGDTNNDGKLNPNETWKYICIVKNVSDDFTNQASVKATAGAATLEAASSKVNVDVINPAIDLEKMVLQSPILRGSDANFTIEIVNNGNVDLFNVKVTDAQCNSGKPTPVNPLGNGDGVLQAGEKWVYTCMISNVQQHLDNVASVSAQDSLGNLVTDGDEEDVDVINPSIHVEVEPEEITVIRGGEATFDIEVDNNGDTNLYNVQVSDAQCTVGPTYKSGDNGDNILQPTEKWHYECIIRNILTDFSHVAAAKAVDANGNSVSYGDEADVDVRNPGIRLQGAQAKQTTLKGSSVSFSFFVNNTGEVDLTDVQLSGDQCTGGATLVNGDNGDGKLAPIESWVFSCTTNNVQQDATHKVTVSAKDGNGNTISDDEQTEVDVVSPGINVEIKTGSGEVVRGAAMDFLIEVRNTGDADLAIVQLTVSFCDGGPQFLSGDTNKDGKLQSSETFVYSCQVSAVNNNFVNLATVGATDQFGNVLTASDDVTIKVPELAVFKLFLPAMTKNN